MILYYTELRPISADYFYMSKRRYFLNIDSTHYAQSCQPYNSTLSMLMTAHPDTTFQVTLKCIKNSYHENKLRTKLTSETMSLACENSSVMENFSFIDTLHDTSIPLDFF